MIHNFVMQKHKNIRTLNNRRHKETCLKYAGKCVLTELKILKLKNSTLMTVKSSSCMSVISYISTYQEKTISSEMLRLRKISKCTEYSNIAVYSIFCTSHMRTVLLPYAWICNLCLTLQGQRNNV